MPFIVTFIGLMMLFPAVITTGRKSLFFVILGVILVLAGATIYEVRH